MKLAYGHRQARRPHRRRIRTSILQQQSMEKSETKITKQTPHTCRQQLTSRSYGKNSGLLPYLACIWTGTEARNHNTHRQRWVAIMAIHLLLKERKRCNRRQTYRQVKGIQNPKLTISMTRFSARPREFHPFVKLTREIQAHLPVNRVDVRRYVFT